MDLIARNAMSRPLLEAAAAKLGIDHRAVRKTAVLLYGEFYISYPYTDATTLPGACKNSVGRTLKVIERALPGLVAQRELDPESPVFNDASSAPHYAIIPVAHPRMWRRSLTELGPEASALYRLIAEAYIAAVTRPRVAARVPA